MNLGGNVFMYVVREFEDALDDCELDAPENNYNSVHVSDEGVRFYAGSLEGVDGKSLGKLFHVPRAGRQAVQELQDVRGGGDRPGRHVRDHHRPFDLFSVGNAQLGMGECATARKTVKEIVDLMFVPMIQGTLRYAYKVSALQGGEVEDEEGFTFAAAILPIVHKHSSGAAATIYQNTKVKATSTNHVAAKKSFESVYEQMGIACAGVGGLWFDGSDGG